MLRLKFHKPGTPPGTLVAPEHVEAEKATVTLVQYDDSTFYEGIMDSLDELMERFDPKKVNWINVDGLGDIELLKGLAERFKIHPLAMEDVLNTTQRPKVEQFSDHFFIVSEMLHFEEDETIIEQLSLFLGDSFLITIQEESTHDAFENVRHRLRSGRGYARSMKADYLAYSLLDAAVDHIFPVLESIGDSIEDIEEKLLERPERSAMRGLYETKRLLLQVRRAAWPHREIFSTLLRDDTGLIRPETKIFLRDCYDHITQIIDMIESYRDLAAGLMDIYLSSLGFRTNEIMKVLTVVTTIFVPMTFLAGVYGMNFDLDSPFNMPELKWRYGYIYFWFLCLILGTSMVLLIKKRKWL